MAFFPPQDSLPKKEREKVPVGTHEAYCYGVVDLGTHARPPYKGKEKDPARMLMLFFEFTEIKHQFKDDAPLEPMVKSQKYGYFTGDTSGLFKLCKTWLGSPVEQVDFDNLAGTPASITIEWEPASNDPTKIYDNMTAIAPMSPKLIPLMPPQYNKTMNFSIMEHGFDSEEFKALYPWVQKVIQESEEYQAYVNGASTPKDDSPPFDN